MKKKLIILIPVMLLCLAVGCCALSSSTPVCFTPTPTPRPTPTATPEVLMDGSFSVQVDTGLETIRLSPVMRYEHNYARGMVADGMVFMSETEYAQHPMFGAIPTARLDGDLDIRVSWTEGCSFSYGVHLYDSGMHQVELEPGTVISSSLLGQGTYLLTIPVSFSCPARSYSGVCFLWLESGTCTPLPAAPARQ